MTILCFAGKNKWHSLRWYTNILAGTGDYGNNTKQRLEEIDTITDIDILFFGSSHCYRGIDTRIYEKQGYRAFNLGSSAQSPLNSYYLLKRYINQLKPKLVVIDVFWGVIEEDGSEPFLNLALNSKFSIEILKMGLMTKNIQALNTYIFSMIYSCLFSKNALQIKSWPDDFYVSGGFVEREKKEFKFIRNLSKSHKIKVNKDQLKYLSKIIRLTKSHSSDIVMITIPVTTEYLGTISNYDTYKNEIIKLSDKYKTPYLDFNKIYSISDKKYFLDEDHLNQNGVTLLNTQLIKILREIGKLK